MRGEAYTTIQGRNKKKGNVRGYARGKTLTFYIQGSTDEPGIHGGSKDFGVSEPPAWSGIWRQHFYKWRGKGLKGGRGESKDQLT